MPCFRALFLLAIVVGLLGCSSDEAPTGSGALPSFADKSRLLTFVPRSAVAAAYVRLTDLMAAEPVRRQLAEFGEHADLPLDSIDDLIFILVGGEPGDPRPPEEVVVMRLRGTGYQRWMEKTYPKRETAEDQGRSYIRLKDPQQRCLHFPDDQTAILGKERVVKRLIDESNRGGACVELLNRPHMRGPVQVATSLKNLWAIAPPGVAERSGIPLWVESASVSLDLGGDCQLDGELEIADSKPAGEAADDLRKLLDLVMQWTNTSFRRADEEIARKFRELADEAKGKAKLTPRGSRIVVSLDGTSKLREAIQAPLSMMAQTARRRNEAMVQAAQVEIRVHSSALERYRFDCKSYPSTKEGLEALLIPPPSLQDKALWKGPYSSPRGFMDPWGHPYRYELASPDKFTITSDGPDGKAKTADDVVAK